jgi:putative addiction module killer protein
MRGQTRILARIKSAEFGHFGDSEPLGAGVFEMRIHFGPGYRLYYTRRGLLVYALLLGGNKSTQKRDIQRAKAMAQALDQEDTQ